MTLPLPLVSICCISYNHEHFIRDAVDSFLKQKTRFPVEIIIHDDASTDKTSVIIKEYHKQNPDLIKLIIQSKNQFSIYGFAFLKDIFKTAKGKYIALCEGDDYWIDPFKLQKQIDFLEKNPEFSICFHKVKILEDEQLKDDYLTRVPAQISTIVDLARQGNYIHTPSCIFRNNGTEAFGPHFLDSPVGDYYIHMINAQFGNLYHIDEAMAVYRVHAKSIWSNKDQLYREIKFQKTRLAVLKDLLPTSSDAFQALAMTYLNQALFLYAKTADSLIREEIISNSSLFLPQLVSLSLQKQIDLDKANSKIRILRDKNPLRRFAKLLKHKLIKTKPEIN